MDSDNTSLREQTGARKAILGTTLKQTFDEAAYGGFRPLLFGIALIYVAFTIANLSGKVLPGYAATWVLAMDVTMLGVSILIFVFVNRRIIGPEIVHPVGGILAVLMVANVEATTVLLQVPFHAVYLVLICVGAGCFMLSRVWLTAVIGVTSISWSILAWGFLESSENAYYALAIFAGAVVSYVVQGARQTAIERVYELRYADALSRERLAQDLYDSEFRNQQIVETAYEGIGITDIGGLIVYINPRLASMFGRSLEDLAGTRFVELVHPDDRDRAARLSANRKVSGPEQYECRYLTSTGETLWCLISASPLRNAAGDFVGALGLFTDVSERKRVEESRRRYSRRLEALQEIDRAILAAESPVAIGQAALTRAVSLAPCDRACILIRESGARTATVLCHENGQLMQHEFGAAEIERCIECRGKRGVFEDDRGQTHIQCVINDSLAGGRLKSLVCRPFVVDGEWLGGLFFGSGVEGAFAEEHHEIASELADNLTLSLRQTQLRRTAEAEQALLNAIIAELPEAVLVLDAQRRIRSLNPAAEQQLPALTKCHVGDVLDEFGGQGLEELLECGDASRWVSLTVDNKPVRHFDAVARRLEESGVGGYIVVSRDVTREKHVQEQVQAQQRIAAIGQLAAGIAHDFNNILQAILMYSELLKHKWDRSDEGRDHIEAIIRQTSRAATLVRQILDFSRKSVRSGHALDLQQLIDETVQLLRRTISERVELLFEEVDPNIETGVKVDPAQMQQLITNLAVNAQDAMPQGGAIRIRLDLHELGPDDDRPYRSMVDGRWVVMTVEDEGHGISGEMQARVFEPFFTTKDPGKGTGLGLAQAYGIVKQHNGYITLQSTPGKGSVFQVYLPQCEIDEVTPSTPARAIEQHGNGELVIVIEDEKPLLQIIKQTLESFGFEVWATSDVEAAVAECQSRARDVRVVLSDVVMPKMSGPEVFRSIRESCPDASYILMSGYPLSEHPEDIAETEHAAWLEKPFEIAHLVETVATAAQDSQNLEAETQFAEFSPRS